MLLRNRSIALLFVGQALFPARMVYGPIDAAALGQYKFMQRIGFKGNRMSV